MAEASRTPFVMHGARDAMAAGLAHLERHVSAIEDAVIKEPGLAFDLARTLLESACRTVLTNRSIPFKDDDDLPHLFKTASTHLPFLPRGTDKNPEIRRSLLQTLNGLHTAVHGICELRNRCGFASHGSATPRPQLESVQAFLAAQAADAIVGFLHRVHLQDRAPLPPPPLRYDDHAAFNESVDEVHGGTIRIFDVELRPSEVLFEMEPQSYGAYLTDFGGNSQTAADPSTEAAE